VANDHGVLGGLVVDIGGGFDFILVFGVFDEFECLDGGSSIFFIFFSVFGIEIVYLFREFIELLDIILYNIIII
jgi:hypothetical protein